MVDPLTYLTTRYLTQWESEFERVSEKIPYDNPAGFKDYLKREHENGRLRILEILKNESRIALVFFKVDYLEKREFQVLSVYSVDMSVDYTFYISALTEQLAKDHGCVSIAFGTVRAGLIKKQISNGYRIAEVILRKDIH